MLNCSTMACPPTDHLLVFINLIDPMLEKLKLGTTLNEARKLMPDLSYYDSGSEIFLNTHDYYLKEYRGNIDLKFKDNLLISLGLSFYKGECKEKTFYDFKDIYADLLKILKEHYGKPEKESSENPSYEGIDNDDNRHDRFILSRDANEFPPQHSEPSTQYYFSPTTTVSLYFFTSPSRLKTSNKIMK